MASVSSWDASLYPSLIDNEWMNRLGNCNANAKKLRVWKIKIKAILYKTVFVFDLKRTKNTKSIDTM